MSKPDDDDVPNREKENMDAPQEEFIADSPHELPPAAKGRGGQPKPESARDKEAAEPAKASLPRSDQGS